VAVARSSSGGVAIPGRSLMSMNVLFVITLRTIRQADLGQSQPRQRRK